jgi:hypothetical protein
MTADLPAPLRSVALPSEHGGWSLTLEPALLGLIVAPTAAGLMLTVAALGAFMARAPLRISLVDRHRKRRLERTRLAERVVAVYAALLAVLVLTAAVVSAHTFWAPLLLAFPLVLIAIVYDMRSKSRRLVPELAGTTGVAAVASAIALAGGVPTGVAWGLWVVAGARGVASVTCVRVQVARAKSNPLSSRVSDMSQALAVAAVAVAGWAGIVSWWAVGAVSLLAVIHVALVRRPVPGISIIGAQQVVLGLVVVITAGLGALAP